MSQGANVRSVDALKDFKIALINFAEEARVALGSTDMEIRHVRNWLTRDQLSYWQSQVKRGQERVSMAKAELFRRQLSQSNSDAVSDTDQKEALRDAQRRLREAEEKVEKIKRWVPVFEHATSEYNSQSQPLGDHLSGSFAATINVLNRMIAALDSYLSEAAPSTPVSAPIHSTPGSRSEAKSTASSAAQSGETAETQAVPAPETLPTAGEKAGATAGKGAGETLAEGRAAAAAGPQ
jgi:capsule polysaccharide export protein KpsE/RkpR